MFPIIVVMIVVGDGTFTIFVVVSITVVSIPTRSPPFCNWCSKGRRLLFIALVVIMSVAVVAVSVAVVAM